MKVLTRQVIVSKPTEEIMQILKSCAHHSSKSFFGENVFAMRCPKRYPGRLTSLTKVTGNISRGEDSATVILEVHAGLCFYIGLVFIFWGFLELNYRLVACSGSWIFCLAEMLFGLVFIGVPVCDAIEHLDIIEHKLTR